MDPEALCTLLKSNLPNSDIEVVGDGRHFEARIISAQFEGMSLIQRQRTVYKAVQEYIENGMLHALSIKAKTPLECQ